MMAMRATLAEGQNSRRRPAVLFLTDEMLRRSLAGGMSYRHIAGSRDGSRVVVRPEVHINYGALVIPAGVAMVLRRSLPKQRGFPLPGDGRA